MRNRFFVRGAAALTLVCALGGAVFGQTFSASVTVPAPVDVAAVATRVNGTGLNPADWQPGAVTSLNFDPMTLFTFPDPANPANSFSIFLPDHFFAIDVGFVFASGASISGVVVSYSQSQPTGGLGSRSTATFVRKTRNADGSEAPETFTGPGNGKSRLIDLVAPGTQVSLTTLAGGWLRLYVGIVAKDPAANPPDPASADVFAPGTTPGTFTGTLVITSF